MTIDHGTVFQLGPTGPSFRFETFHEIPVSDTTSMHSALPAMGDALRIDEANMEEQVERIAETPYFQQLKKLSEDLQRPAATPDNKDDG